MANRNGKKSVWQRVSERARRGTPRKSNSSGGSSKMGRVGSVAVGFAETVGAAGLTGAYHGAVGENVGPVRATTVTRTTGGFLAILGVVQAWRGKPSSKHFMALGEGIVAAEVGHAARERVAKMKADRAAAEAAAVPVAATPAPAPAPGAHGLGADFQFLISDKEGLANPPPLAGERQNVLHPLLG